MKQLVLILSINTRKLNKNGFILTIVTGMYKDFKFYFACFNTLLCISALYK